MAYTTRQLNAETKAQSKNQAKALAKAHKKRVAQEKAELRKRIGPWYKRVARHFSLYWQLWLMVAPAMLLVIIFNYVPMYGIQLAFRRYDPTKGLTGGEWVGFEYFQKFFNDALFTRIIANTLRISLWTLVMGFFAPIILALLINQIGGAKTKKFVQTITYMPHFISTVVMVSILNIFLAPDSGMIGRLFPHMNLMGSQAAFTPIYWISEIWQHCGWNCIIYLAALASVDTSLYEAAKIDGAGRLQLIRYVDIPALLPTAGILLIMNMGSVLGVGFEKIFLMQNTLNIQASEVISTYTYRIGILSTQFSYSTAIGLFNSLVNFVFLITANQIAKKVSNTSLF
ncbi:ABC transporter permease [Alloscardovia venturai]|uniref:ABC transporter permease n=1 Tax=Alloscardovia venturai TaxID=1769421 RepID=A0ABW2Y5R7_9BIFI